MGAGTAYAVLQTEMTAIIFLSDSSLRHTKVELNRKV